MSVQGLWNIAGVNLPDFGISEKLGIGPNNAAVTAPGGNQSMNFPANNYNGFNTPTVTNAPYNPPQPTKITTNTSNFRTPSALPGNTPPTASPTLPYQQIQNQQDAGNTQIEADYNQAMSNLDNAQSGLNSQASQASGVIDTGLQDVQNQIQNSQTVGQQGVNSTLQTAQTNANQQNQQARDMFRQQQQANNAQLSALGISSSSVTSALAEKLGVETARRIAGVSGNLADIQTNAQQELGRINTYYSGQLTNAQKQAGDQKAAIQNSLIQGLNQINASRSQAASDKANSRANLIQQTQSAIYNLTQQQQAYQASLNQWAQQKAAALTPIAQDPNYVQNILNASNTISQQYSPTGFVATPSFNVNSQGNYSGQINLQKKPLVDQYGNPVDPTAPPKF